MSSRDVQVRIRKRIRDRLDELGMTARELGRAVGHDDAWISGVLGGRHGIHWKDFDAVAHKLRMAPSELVRLDETDLRELTPSEMKWIRHYQSWPEAIRDRWLSVLDFFSSTAPDPDAAVLLTLLREVPPSLRGPTIDWLRRLLREGIPPEQLLGGAGLARGGESDERGARHHAHHDGRKHANRARRERA